MSTTNIPEKVKIRLWGKASGRCEYEGCNKPLWLDSLTKAEFNVAYIAHIIADKPGGPRGDFVLSEKLKADISNLMLMCDEHHRLIDKENIEGHPVERLQEMKRKHEDRIELLGSLMEDKRSYMLFYEANIGNHRVKVNWNRAVQAMLPNWYPAERKPIMLSWRNSSYYDNEEEYWLMEREHLRRQFNERVKPMLSDGQDQHFSIFAIADQPLLIELGRLIGGINIVEVYQLHREPQDWKWQGESGQFDYIVHEPPECREKVALNLSLSATIDNSRITKVLGKDVSIWTLTIENPNVDFLKSREQLCLFREKCRQLFERIKMKHGEGLVLNLFPAIPVSIAVEIGRVWMPKADMPIRIYDQNQQTGGFTQAFEIVD